MAQPKYNPQTKKFEFPKDAPATAAPSDMAYMAIPRSVVAQLVKFGKADGAQMIGTTEKGTQVAESKVARIYVLQAIQDLIDARTGGKS